MEGCFMFQWGAGGVFQMGELPCPPSHVPQWETLFWCLKRFHKKYTVTNLVKPEISVSNFFFFHLVLWGKMCKKVKNTAGCSRKFKIKETFEYFSHDFGCKVALAFHSSEVEEMITTDNITVGIGNDLSFVSDPFPFWNFVSPPSKAVKHFES